MEDKLDLLALQKEVRMEIKTCSTCGRYDDCRISNANWVCFNSSAWEPNKELTKNVSQYVRIKTLSQPHMYVYSINGVVHLTWVTEQDKANSLIFPIEKQHEWRACLENICDVPLISELI